jgi:hypothetical protein
MIIVTVDSDHEDVVAACREFREQLVYPDLVAAGAALDSFGGDDATRAKVSAALTAPGTRALSGSGHGVEERFNGQDGRALLEIGRYDPAEVRGKVVHLLACLTAAQLGPDLVQNGCRAFFGYDVIFAFQLENRELFLDCDAQFDRSLVEGKSAGDAYADAFDAFTLQIEALLAQGQPYLAAMLEYDRDHLCAPPVDSRFGSAAAKL